MLTKPRHFPSENRANVTRYTIITGRLSRPKSMSDVPCINVARTKTDDSLQNPETEASERNRSSGGLGDVPAAFPVLDGNWLAVFGAWTGFLAHPDAKHVGLRQEVRLRNDQFVVYVPHKMTILICRKSCRKSAQNTLKPLCFGGSV